MVAFQPMFYKEKQELGHIACLLSRSNLSLSYNRSFQSDLELNLVIKQIS